MRLQTTTCRRRFPVERWLYVTTTRTPATPRAAEGERTFLGQPRGLAHLFGVEMWERFSFYGMQGILLYYLYYSAAHGGLGIDATTAAGVVGAYGGSVYLATIVGDPAALKPGDVVTLPIFGAGEVRAADAHSVVIELAGGEVREDLLPVLAGKAMVDGEVTTYVCENFACQAPLVGAEAAEAELAQA